MAYHVILTSRAEKQLASLQTRDQHRILIRMETLADNPRPAGAVKLVGTDDGWRIRIGNFRVLYEIRDRELIVLVVEIGHRRDVYRRTR
ncbi:MAG: type II toxin-antitoxin system RelE/ParE family toxin [Candidatus Sumerlaeia bacterium]